MPNIDSQITALQYNVGALCALLGGSSEERQRFFEIHKGITTPAVFERLVKGELDQINDQVIQTQAFVHPDGAEVRRRRRPSSWSAEAHPGTVRGLPVTPRFPSLDGELGLPSPFSTRVSPHRSGRCSAHHDATCDA